MSDDVPRPKRTGTLREAFDKKDHAFEVHEPDCESEGACTWPWCDCWNEAIRDRA